MSYHQIWNTLYIPPCSDKTNTLYVTSFRPPFISSFLPLLRITIFPFFPGIAYTSFSFLLMCFISLREIHTHTHTHSRTSLSPCGRNNLDANSQGHTPNLFSRDESVPWRETRGSRKSNDISVDLSFEAYINRYKSSFNCNVRLSSLETSGDDWLDNFWLEKLAHLRQNE